MAIPGKGVLKDHRAEVRLTGRLTPFFLKVDVVLNLGAELQEARPGLNSGLRLQLNIKYLLGCEP